jgi:fimbrial chaperone protein
MRTRVQKAVTIISFILAVALASLSNDAKAMSVSPPDLEMSTAGAKSRAAITVKNPGLSPLPIQVLTFQMELSEKGEQTLTPSTGDFSIFPSTVLIPPGSTQVIRIQWTGSAKLLQSKHFMLTIGQVPVKMPKTQNGFNVVVGFGVAVSVSPPEAQANLTVRKVDVVSVQGKRRALVTFHNSGNKHARISDTRLTMSGGKWEHKIEPAMFKSSVGIGLVPAGKSRAIIMPVDIPDNAGPVTVRLNFAAG